MFLSPSSSLLSFSPLSTLLLDVGVILCSYVFICILLPICIVVICSCLFVGGWLLSVAVGGCCCWLTLVVFGVVLGCYLWFLLLLVVVGVLCCCCWLLVVVGEGVRCCCCWLLVAVCWLFVVRWLSFAVFCWLSLLLFLLVRVVAAVIQIVSVVVAFNVLKDRSCNEIANAGSSVCCVRQAS